ncbi:MAG: tetratricopeptide repeat protein [Pyrinomonadaceae bacterium]|nr:tetratricopeptide repeat protein [Pyrinomonadaceae bacterium]
MRVLLMVSIISVGLAVSVFSQTNLAEQNFNKGTELAKSGKHEKAIGNYRTALRSVGSDKKLRSKIHYNIGSCFYQLKEFKDAEKWFIKAVKLSKNSYVQAIYSLGLTQIELEKLRSAEANFRKVIRLDEKHGEAWFDLGMVLLERKMFKNAKIAFEMSIEYKTTRLAEAQNNLGVITAAQGNYSHPVYGVVRANQTNRAL